ncbi:hypothetical protein B1Q42_001124 [Salmonella enterica subsp. diarizonae serovar 16:z10:e,n,x,z15]|nr:hypothetical protein [Salmonella enterica subsp. enterica serovar Redlands]EDT1446216.1 hypothetical protein [Salmonella enterica subsp. diarizonae]EDX2472493.1 hypothetical protein [Salmonella enterica subsp. diarizonae serovar 16:z10:e,n,x,z15]
MVAPWPSKIRNNKFIEKIEDELDGDHYTICKNGCVVIIAVKVCQR